MLPNTKNHRKLSRYLQDTLRHRPDAIGLQLDPHGWADIESIIQFAKNRSGNNLNRAMITSMIRQDAKQRYALSPDGKKMRVNQGHSIKVDLGLKQVMPPGDLYHGTASQFLYSIMKHGLQSRGSQFVHLSSNPQIAYSVGKRHGNPLVLVIAAKRMHEEGMHFYLSDNKIWLTARVHAKYLVLNEVSDTNGQIHHSDES